MFSTQRSRCPHQVSSDLWITHYSMTTLPSEHDHNRQQKRAHCYIASKLTLLMNVWCFPNAWDTRWLFPVLVGKSFLFLQWALEPHVPLPNRHRNSAIVSSAQINTPRSLFPSWLIARPLANHCGMRVKQCWNIAEVTLKWVLACPYIAKQ